MMNVIFIEAFSGTELLQMMSHDVAGILAAAQGESVTFPVGHFKYEFHNLDFYEENGEIRQELVIYVKKI
ncbi:MULTISPECIES: thymidylate synthase [Lysinibacillus]|nr:MULTISPECIES: thymidylate synthase [Lysinibacillus]